MTRGIFQKLALILTAVLFAPASAYAASIDQEIDKYFAPFSDVFSKIVFYPANIAGVKVPLLFCFF